MAHQPMAAVVHLVLGFLVLVSKNNEVAMVCHHERRHGGPIKSLRYISLKQAIKILLYSHLHISVYLNIWSFFVFQLFLGRFL
jgi:hypothetical protein